MENRIAQRLIYHLRAYGLALVINVLALFLTLLFSLVAEPSPYPLLAAAVALSVWYGGWGPGLLSALLVFLTTDYFFGSPRYTILLGPEDWARFSLFMLVVVFVGFLAWRHKRAERILQDSEERYRLLFDNSLDGILLTAPDGSIFAANAAACRILERTEEEICQAGRSGLVDPSDPRLPAALEERSRTGKFRGELIFIRKDGTKIPCEVSSGVFKDKEGNLRTSMIIHDIAKRKRTEEALIKLSSAIEQTGDNVFITNRDGLIEYVNPAFEALTGYARDEAIGRTPRILKSDRHGPEFYSQLWQTILSGGIFRGELFNRKKYGELYYEEKTITPIRDQQGIITHFVSTGKNITERVQAFQTLERRVEERTSEIAQLYAQTEQRSRELEALYRADEQLYRHLHLDQVLQSLVDVVVDILHADKTSVQVWDPQRERLVVRAARGYDPETILQLSSYAPGDGIAGKVFLTGEAMAVADARDAPPPANWIAEKEGIRSVLSVPISVGGQIFGVFGMNYCQSRTFSAEDKRLFLSLAQRAAIAIENARLYEQAEQAAALEERQRLARELHDSVTQSLYSLMLMAEAGRRLASAGDSAQVERQLTRLGETAQQALKEMRLMVYEMRPLVLQKVGLVQALQQRLDAVEKRAGIQARLVVEGQFDLPAPLEEELYRIVQEALNNSLKHAASTSTTVRLYSDGEYIESEVEDKGKGFDLNGAGDQGGIGLDSMRERAERLGANLTIDSAPGRGTTVRIKAKIPGHLPAGPSSEVS